MMKRAGELARELFQDTLFEPPRSRVVKRRLEAVVSFGGRAFILCGFLKLENAAAVVPLISMKRAHDNAKIMHSRPQARHTGRIWQVSVEQIEATASEFLGPGRVKGSGRQSTFSRHVPMPLARHLSEWSCPKISRFSFDSSKLQRRLVGDSRT